MDIPREIAEAALAHSVGGVEGQYQRGDYFNTRRALIGALGGVLWRGGQVTPEEFKRRALAHLDQCDEAEADQLATDQPGADLFADLHARFGHARAAFPGMTWEEFAAIATSRARKGKRADRRAHGLMTTLARRAGRGEDQGAMEGAAFELIPPALSTHWILLRNGTEFRDSRLMIELTGPRLAAPETPPRNG